MDAFGLSPTVYFHEFVLAHKQLNDSREDRRRRKKEKRRRFGFQAIARGLCGRAAIDAPLAVREETDLFLRFAVEGGIRVLHPNRNHVMVGIRRRRRELSA